MGQKIICRYSIFKNTKIGSRSKSLEKFSKLRKKVGRKGKNKMMPQELPSISKELPHLLKIKWWRSCLSFKTMNTPILTFPKFRKNRCSSTMSNCFSITIIRDISQGQKQTDFNHKVVNAQKISMSRQFKKLKVS